MRAKWQGPGAEPPFFFTKPADAIVASGSIIPYASMTSNLHHEIELVVALGSVGANILAEEALGHVYGYAAGIDLTRRDLQKQARDGGKPWDLQKASTNQRQSEQSGRQPKSDIPPRAA